MVQSPMKRTSFFTLFLLTGTSSPLLPTTPRLPDGKPSSQCGRSRSTSRRLYYVDANARNADDNGPGTNERPFRTIDHAAQVLQPGENVIIGSGVYREAIRPARGGTSPDAMISYEAAPGADVVISGAAVTAGWQPSEGWNIGADNETNQPVKAYQLHLDPKLFPLGYNPFALANVTDDRYCTGSTTPRTICGTTSGGGAWSLWTASRWSRWNRRRPSQGFRRAR